VNILPEYLYYSEKACAILDLGRLKGAPALQIEQATDKALSISF